MCPAASRIGRITEAIRVAGAAAALRDNIGAPLPPAERTALERHLSVARTTLGSQAADLALAEGRVVSPAQAIAEAMALLASLEARAR